VGANPLGAGIVSLWGMHVQGKSLPGRGLRNTGNLRSAFYLWGCGVACPAEPGYGADCQKRPLRSRFRQRLIPSIDMICIANGCARRTLID
jgi:hypothetical protein